MMFAGDLPIHKRPGYNQKNFAGGNVQSPAESAEQWAQTGPGHQQKYEAVDHDRSAIFARTVFHNEPGQGELGHLPPSAMFPEGTTTPEKVDPAASPPGAFSRGIHPNWDPANRESREANPPPTAAKNAQAIGWTETSPQGDVYRNVGYGSAWIGHEPHSIDNNIPPRPPLSSAQFST